MNPIASRKVVKVLQVRKESDVHTTLSYKDPTPAKPGQFMMVWIPGSDEVPMGYSKIGGIKEFTVHKVGEATTALSNLKEGDKIGIRGPLGNGFKPTGKKVLIVGGGTGICPLTPLAEELSKQGSELDIALGTTTYTQMPLEERMDACGNIKIATDDGTNGYHGFVTDLAKELLEQNRYDQVYTCGPEIMMTKIVEACKDIPCQASLERHMKCGIGICDSCAMEGQRVCVDGPVFTAEQLAGSKEFGLQKREPNGSFAPL